MFQRGFAVNTGVSHSEPLVASPREPCYSGRVNSSEIRRRWMGVICLGVAILMVVWGQFFLPQSWPPLLQMSFWLLCFVFTLAAILVACADLFALRRRTREERQALMEEAMHEIEKEATQSAARH